MTVVLEIDVRSSSLNRRTSPRASTASAGTIQARRRVVGAAGPAAIPGAAHRPAVGDALLQQLGEVEDLDAALFGCGDGAEAGLEHLHAERAGDGDDVGAGLDGLCERTTLMRSPRFSSTHM